MHRHFILTRKPKLKLTQKYRFRFGPGPGYRPIEIFLDPKVSVESMSILRSIGCSKYPRYFVYISYIWYFEYVFDISYNFQFLGLVFSYSFGFQVKFQKKKLDILIKFKVDFGFSSQISGKTFFWIFKYFWVFVWVFEYVLCTKLLNILIIFSDLILIIKYINYF